MKPRDVKRAVLVLVCILLQPAGLISRACAAAGDVDVSFDPGSGVNNQVRLIAPQADGKVIIAGEFNTVRGLRRIGIARINPDGAGDPTFNAGDAGVGRYFTSLGVQPDGTILLGAEDGLIRLDSNGGGETLINIPTYQKICYSWGCAYGINTHTVQPDGKILIGGYFTTNNGAATNYGIARLLPDGSIDSGFSATVAPSVEGAPTSEGVSVIELFPDGKLLIAGFFSRINGVSRLGVARLHSDGRLDESFNANASIGANAALAKIQTDGKVLVGGIDSPDSETLVRVNSDGSLDTGFHFDRALLDTLATFVPLPNGSILVAGFVNSFGWEGRRLIRLLPNGSLDQTFDAPAAGGRLASIRKVAVQSDGRILIGGEVSPVGEIRRTGLARLFPDGGLDADFRSDTGLKGIRTPDVRSVALQPDGKVLVGGFWMRTAGLAVFGITRYNPDGTSDDAFSPPADTIVAALALQPDGKILLGDDQIGQEDRGRALVSRLLPGGEPDHSFRFTLGDLPLDDDCPPDVAQNGGWCFVSSAVTAIVLQTDGRLIIRGVRITVLCYPAGCAVIDRHFVARLHPDGRFDDTFRVAQFGIPEGASPRSLIVQPDGRVIIAGNFVERLNLDGGHDASFAPALPATGETMAVTALALQPDGRILVGKDIVQSGKIVRHEITRLNPDGSVDASFHAGEDANGSVHSILVQPGGKIIIAGDFTRVDGAGHYRIARLHPDGSLDGTFHAGTGADESVQTMAATADGVFIGGGFNSIRSLARPGIAKLHAQPGGPIPFGTWIARFDLSGPGAAVAADPDRDGLPNSVEYVLGGNPATPDRWNRPAAKAGADHMSFTFLRDDASETPDVVLTVETGTDLITWPGVFTIGPDTAASSPGVSIAENGAAADTITVTIPQGTAARRFVRLKTAITP
jgi:uncharacterized delta-60 repeat protein